MGPYRMSQSSEMAGLVGGDGRDVVQLLQALLAPLREQLASIQRQVTKGVEKEAYTVEEAAERLDLTAWTVRQACNRGRIRARKVPGRGKKGQWRIPHDELVRALNEGLPPAKFVPQPPPRQNVRQATDSTTATGPKTDPRRPRSCHGDRRDTGGTGPTRRRPAHSR